MERKKRLSKRTASVRIEPYLAEYIQKKLEIEPETGGVKIPYTTDLYHVVWNCMAKPDLIMMSCKTVISRYICLHGAQRWMDILVRIRLTSIIFPVMRRKK